LQYRSRTTAGPRVSVLPAILIALVVLVVAAALFVGFRMMFAKKPEVSLGSPFEVVGRNAPLVVDVKDQKHGLRSVRVTVSQAETEQVVFEESYEPPRTEVQVKWLPAQEKRFKLKEGEGKVKVVARNASWGGFFKGSTATLEQPFTARLTPPRLEVLTTQHYVNQGGCDMVVYRVTPPDAESGVVVGDAFFKGFPLPGAPEPNVHFAIFNYPYDAKPGAVVRLRARDVAKNESLIGFWIKVFPKKFRERDLPLDDAFLNKVVPEILSQTPSLQDQGDLLKNYLQINRDLRKTNNAQLAELANTKSAPRFLWTEPFKQLTNSQVEANFADHRTYTHGGKEVDRQDHLGYDLATTANAKVEASNDGVVLLAEFFGIYGNTVVLDHGYGLLSLYGHLSSFAVKPGDTVKRGQTIAQSGATGLAGGDHLHFSMIFQGAQVDAREWWDPHWIEDRITAKLQQFGAAAAAPASPAPGAPSPAAR
jgi:murein DD-endopeptidase MepM/ murein hydrolase activator NlpD